MINKVTLLGRIGNLDTKALQDGTLVANFSLATNENWTGKDGQKNQNTTWHKCVAFGKVADIISHYVRKGELLHVEGKLTNRSWDDKEGGKHQVTEIKVMEVVLMPNPNKKAEVEKDEVQNKKVQNNEVQNNETTSSDIPF